MKFCCFVGEEEVDDILNLKAIIHWMLQVSSLRYVEVTTSLFSQNPELPAYVESHFFFGIHNRSTFYWELKISMSEFKT